jgi:hypothetical protein
MSFATNAVKITGEPRYYEVTADSGNKRKLGFCASCGSPLFSRRDAARGAIGIMAASLDDPDLFHPAMSIYTSRAPAWAPFSAGLKSFPEAP